MAPAEPAAAAPEAGRLRLAGALTLDGVVVKSGKEGEFALDLEALQLGLERVELPGLLAPPGGKPPSEGPQLRLSRVKLSKPKLRLTRTADGIVLPAASGSEGKSGGKTTEATERKAASAGPALRLELAQLALEGGSLRLLDRTVKPFYQGDISALEVEASGIALPELRVADYSVNLQAPGSAPLWALGSHTPASSWFELQLDKLPLPPLNPYVRSYIGYSAGGGDLSLYSKGSVTKGRLYSDNFLTLSDLELSGAQPDARLDQALGMPAKAAVSLLKGPGGNIELSVPIEFDEKGADVGLTSVIGSTLREVLISAVSSPLKMLGAVVGPGGKVKDPTPAAITFRPGQTELAADGEERVAALAKIAAMLPGLVLKLSGQTSASDAEHLREARLLEALDSGDDLPEAAQGIGQALARRRLRDALEARLAGEPGELDADDEQKLALWLGTTEVSPQDLVDLARARAARAQELLKQRFGIEARQLELADPGAPGAAPEPSVAVTVAS